MTALDWVKPYGGKRYSAVGSRGRYELVRQNTAAGAAPWKATVQRSGQTWVLAKTQYLSDAKAAAERDAATV